MFRGEANLDFSRKYGRVMMAALLGALAVHVVAGAYSPPYAPTPYRLREENTVAVDVQDFEIAKPPEEIQRPDIPSEVEESEEASEEETIAPTDFDPFEPPEVTTDNTGPESFFAFDSPPQAVRTVSPDYPDLARQAEAEGRVWIRVTIDETGRVIKAEVENSEVIPSLEKAAIDAAKKWLFKPAKQRDVPVKSQIMIPFNFSLR